MKRNKKAIILVILLGSISLWFILHNNNSTIKRNLRDFAVNDTAAITKIFLADKNGRTITLQREAPNQWTVNGTYKAQMQTINTLLTTIRKVDVKEPVSKKAQDNIVKRLAAKAVRCEIYSKEKLIKAYYVGTETQDQTGTYMIMIDPETMKPAEKPFITYIPGFEGYLTTRYFTEEIGWRDRTIFHYVPDEIRSVKMEVPYNPEYGYEIVTDGKNSFDIKLLATHQSLPNLDTMAVKQYLSYFQQLNFENFEVELTQKQIDSVVKSKPVNILSVTDKDGKTKKITFFAKKAKFGQTEGNGQQAKFDPERMHALMDNGKDFVLVQFFMLGKVLPPPSYFQKQSSQTDTNKEKSKA